MPIQLSQPGELGQLLADQNSVTPRDPIVGIDLGTTHSLVAVAQDGKIRVLKSSEESHLLPSVVTFKDGKPLVGQQAKRNKVRGARNTVYSVKRLLGKNLSDLKGLPGTLPYEVVELNGLTHVKVEDKAYTPIEISSWILLALKSAAERELGQPVHRAVITVPAYFNDSQRQATRTAGRIAGLDVLRIINEPTAASLAYGLDQKNQGLIAVYDLGGGTFDISILKLHNGIFEVLATNGDTQLGGDDLDQAIAQVALKEIQDSGQASPRTLDQAEFETQLWASLLEAAEATKIALSEKEQVTLAIQVDGFSYSREWTRAQFDALVSPILERTRPACLRALQDAGLNAADLSDVILVGGPSRLPIVQAKVESIFGKKPNTSMHPDEVVAEGAAIQADILAGNRKDLLLLDVVPLSLGLETYGGIMSTLIPRNSRIPAVARETFTTFVENQTGVDVHVLQGEREKVSDNRTLAKFKLAGIQPMAAGLPRIEVSFLIDADGILQVAAKDLKTGKEQSIEVRPSHGLTDAQVEKMLLERIENEKADRAYRSLVDARNDAAPTLKAVEKNLPFAQQTLPEDELRGIQTAVETLRRTLQGEDPQAIKAATAELNRLTVNLANALLLGGLNA